MASPAAQPPQSPYSSVMLEYLQSSPVKVRGPVSGREYEFSGTKRIQYVTAVDASPLVRSGFFRRRS